MFKAALHLVCFGGLVAEAFHEALYVGDFLLLVFIGAQLLFAAFGTQFHVFVIAHAVVGYLAHAYFHGAVGNVVQERAVVAYEQHGA